MTQLYPPPHMTHMHPPPHMTHMHPPPHMTHMYIPPQHYPNLLLLSLVPPLTATAASSSNTPTDALRANKCTLLLCLFALTFTLLLLVGRCAPMRRFSASVTQLSGRERMERRPKRCGDSAWRAWRELEEALETSASTDHVRRALALNMNITTFFEVCIRHCLLFSEPSTLNPKP